MFVAIAVNYACMPEFISTALRARLSFTEHFPIINLGS